ncbi:hypothetical protein Bca52824_047699 [Brassica carinata]|uniref:Uncharacterized protein n=1 Tax=Brassica carinata TaxID=52824 RepID=A0A8X7RH38_BRACI|nr:hypothetical protein Bca52824_047699 [Brassica carinata]
MVQVFLSEYEENRESPYMPKNWWERVKFPRNYGKTLETIDSIWQVKLDLYWPKLLQHKEKQRLTKMTQLRMRKLALRTRLGEAVVLDKVTHPFFRFDQLVSLLIMPSRLNC